MKIKIIGCSGAEFPGHNSPSFLLDDEIAFDAGSITDSLTEKAQLMIKHIFITHAHLDHIKSIPFLADNIIVGSMNHRVIIMSIPSVIKTIKMHLFNSTMWPDFTVIPHPDDAVLKLVKLKYNSPVELNGYTVTPFRVNHAVPSVDISSRTGKRGGFFIPEIPGQLQEPGGRSEILTYTALSSMSLSPIAWSHWRYRRDILPRTC